MHLYCRLFCFFAQAPTVPNGDCQQHIWDRLLQPPTAQMCIQQKTSSAPVVMPHLDHANQKYTIIVHSQ